MKMLLSILLCFSSGAAQVSSAGMATSLGAIYESEAGRGSAALYITPDVVFERVHFFFSSALEELEERQLAPELEKMLDELYEALRKARSRAADNPAGELLARNLEHIQVARYLLDDDDGPPSAQATEELKLILAADRAAVSPVMGYPEDYTQYIPRGHYTKSEKLERYFRTMTWLGRAAFYVESNPAAGIDEELAARLTAQAMLLIAAGSRIKSVARRLTKFESAVAAMLGPSDDLTLAEADSLIARAAGERWAELENGADFTAAIGVRPVQQARAALVANARRPRMFSARLTEGRLSPPLSIRVIGQRFSVDSYAFQTLTFDRVQDLALSRAEQSRLAANKNRSPSPGTQPPALLTTLSITRQKRQVRGIPRGLDFLAALGSKLARAELARALDDRYVGYSEQSGKLQAELPQMLKSNGGFASHYLLAVQNLLGDETPLSLNSALGAWILLRHDLSAYVKQSYTSIPKSLPPRRPAPAKLPPIYVAPAAATFRELAEAVEALAEQMESEKRAPALRLVETLKLLADRAGSGALLEDEAGQVYSIICRQQSNRISIVIADLHTDPISGEVLQAGLGTGRNSLFAVKGGKQATGAIFAYYEFRRPSSQRMNDDQWQKEIKSNGFKHPPFAPGLQAGSHIK